MAQKQKNLNFKRQKYKKKSSKASGKQKQTWMWLGVGVAAIIIVAAAVILIPKFTGNTQISVTQAYQEYQQGVFFLDVRTQTEWNQAHIANSTLIPLDELQSHINDLPKDRDIIVVCQTGHRATEGVTLLRKAGFSRASIMTGGLAAWKAAGYPLDGSDPYSVEDPAQDAR